MTRTQQLDQWNGSMRASDAIMQKATPGGIGGAMVDLLIRDFMRSVLVAASSLCLILAPSVSAQTISEAQMRAANLARMQAEVINGGGSKYSPANCMHQGGGGNCLESKTSLGFRFRFLGGPAGWAAKREPATIETVVFVSPDGMLSKVEYNGPLRTSQNP